MNYQQAMEYIHSIMRFGSKLGLERMNELLHRLGDPHRQTKFVHVAGTNGKGSTVTMLANVLHSAGYKVGKYTSPYVYDFRERIAVDGKVITKDALCRWIERISTVCSQMEKDGWDAVTEFEVVTALGFCYFAEQQCDIVVLEVGLGGRFDATNVIDSPLVAVITALALDHMTILGDTIEKIAFEKAGIIKTGTKTVLYPLQPQGAWDEICSICSRRDVPLCMPKVSKLNILQSDLNGNRFVYKGTEFQQTLLGEYQIYNAVTVIEAVSVLQAAGFQISEKALFDGIYKTHMPARFDVLCRKPLIIADAGHNPQGIDALSALLDKTKGKKKIVFSVMKDKEYPYAIKEIARRADCFYAATLPMERALSAEEIQRNAAEYCTETAAFSSVEQALATALSDMDGVIVICGSFYMMEAAGKYLENQGILDI